MAQQNIQQLLGLMWYEGLPGFRRRSLTGKCIEMSKIALLFPFFCCLYIMAPNTHYGQLMRKPFVKFLIHASSYLFFLRTSTYDSSILYMNIPLRFLSFQALSVTSRDNCYHRDFSFPMLNSMNFIIETVGLKFVGSGCIFIPRC